MAPESASAYHHRMNRWRSIGLGVPGALTAALWAVSHHWLQAALFGATAASWLLSSILRRSKTLGAPA